MWAVLQTSGDRIFVNSVVVLTDPPRLHCILATCVNPVHRIASSHVMVDCYLLIGLWNLIGGGGML